MTNTATLRLDPVFNIVSLLELDFSEKLWLRPDYCAKEEVLALYPDFKNRRFPDFLQRH
jgi:hypothetical protein